MNTPQTDKAERDWEQDYERIRECGWPSMGHAVDADFARELELENNLIRSLLSSLVSAYEREVRTTNDWTDTALTKEEWDDATKEYRAAKEWLEKNALQ